MLDLIQFVIANAPKPATPTPSARVSRNRHSFAAKFATKNRISAAASTIDKREIPFPICCEIIQIWHKMKEENFFCLNLTPDYSIWTSLFSEHQSYLSQSEMQNKIFDNSNVLQNLVCFLQEFHFLSAVFSIRNFAILFFPFFLCFFYFFVTIWIGYFN